MMEAYLKSMSNLAFDTHKFVKDLTKAGMKDHQTEVLASHYANLLTDRLATKDDLIGLEERFNSKMTITILSAQIVTIATICTVTGFLLSVN